jgi:hypothetical protein
MFSTCSLIPHIRCPTSEFSLVVDILLRDLVLKLYMLLLDIFDFNDQTGHFQDPRHTHFFLQAFRIGQDTSEHLRQSP